MASANRRPDHDRSASQLLTFEEAGPALDLAAGVGLVRLVQAVGVTVAVPRLGDADTRLLTPADQREQSGPAAAPSGRLPWSYIALWNEQLRVKTTCIESTNQNGWETQQMHNGSSYEQEFRRHAESQASQL